ncbi:MAG: hypothetical protein ACYS22_01715 [Planctomycetota bacterium]
MNVASSMNSRASEQGAALTSFAVVLGLILVGMGSTYLGATRLSYQSARLAEGRAVTRAAIEGALELVLEGPVREAFESPKETRHVLPIGATKVEAHLAPVGNTNLRVRIRLKASKHTFQGDVAVSTLQCVATRRPDGTVKTGPVVVTGR